MVGSPKEEEEPLGAENSLPHHKEVLVLISIISIIGKRNFYH